MQLRPRFACHHAFSCVNSLTPASVNPAHPTTPKVYSELLGSIEFPLQALSQLEFTTEQLAAALDAAGPHDVLHCLDMRAAEGGGGQWRCTCSAASGRLS